jgi:phospholipid/cholesterol/gamma-HCH transport system substrate-binding protein
LAALVLAVVVVVIAIGRDGDDGYEVTAEFANASQLVDGNQVTLGGVPVGTVERIELGDDGQALVTFTVDDDHAPLDAGTTATVRSVSLASIAGRRVELVPPVASSGSQIPDGGAIDQSQTTSEVDLDQVLNTLDPAALADLERLVEGFASTYEGGVARQANRGFEYLNPLLSSSRRALSELGRDREALERLIVDSSQLSGALAERAPDISALIRNLDLAAGALGRQRTAITQAVGRLPGFLRNANTTFVNLRAALDDLDPLMIAALPVARRLGPFFREFRLAARDAVPTLRYLDAILRRRGADNDLVELTASAPALAEVGVGEGSPDCSVAGSSFEAAADGDFDQGALGEATCALSNSLPIVTHLRPYSPEAVGWLDDFSTSGAIDANGGIARIAGTFNAFTLAGGNGLPELLSPVDPDQFFSATPISIGNNSRCPGSNERDQGDGTMPFTDGGTLNCDPSQVPLGP